MVLPHTAQRGKVKIPLFNHLKKMFVKKITRLND